MDESLQFYRTIVPEDMQPIPLLPFAEVAMLPTLEGYSTTETRVQIPPALATKLKHVARQQRATSFHLYLAALQSLLFRMLPDTDTFFIGIADAHRHDKDFIGTVGLLFNLVPLRFDRPKSAAKFREAIEGTRNIVHNALKHSAVPIDIIFKALNVPRSSSAAPVFQILVDYRLVLQDRLEYVGCKLSDKSWQTSRTGYNIGLEITENPSGTCNLTLLMQDAIYSPESTELFMRSFVTVLEQVGRGADVKMSELLIWATGDVDAAIAAGRGPDLHLEWPSTISHRVDEVGEEFPAHEAIREVSGYSLTYKDMLSKVNAIAVALRSSGPTGGTVVGVLQTPSANWICSLLGIMKAGGVYLPLDLRNYIPRLKRIVSASQPSIILVDSHMDEVILELNCTHTKALNATHVEKPSSAIFSNFVTAWSPAVMLFTSCSTGGPKGIVLSHHGVCAHVEGFHRAFSISTMTRLVLQQSSYSFDYSLNQIFAALAGGGCLLVAPEAARGDPRTLADIIVKHGITYTSTTPSEYEMWFQYASDTLRRSDSWQAAWFGGEPATRSMIDSFLSLDLNLCTFSGYGPAEMTISSTKAEMRLQGMTLPLPGGRMLFNYSACIVDRDLRPVHLGVSGEIVLSGVGVSLGSWNQDALTSKSFIHILPATAHSHYLNNGWNFAYRSGDRGRVKAGYRYCDGRIDGDTQVKIRGFRFELGEIETAILKEGGGSIKSAVVSLRDGVLAAHVVLSLEAANQASDVIAKIRGRLPLPSYIRPSIVEVLGQMPLTSHGKVDRRAIAGLPLPDSATTVSHTFSDLQPIDILLLDLWTKTLPQLSAHVERRTDFFQVGGNSLLLVQLQSMMRQMLGTVPRLVDLMNASSLEGMAKLVDEAGFNTCISWEAETALETAPFGCVYRLDGGPFSYRRPRTARATDWCHWASRKLRSPELGQKSFHQRDNLPRSKEASPDFDTVEL